MNNYKVCLIIGNGFDLNMGLHTRYSEFYQHLEKTGFFSTNADCEFIQFMKKCPDYWYNFELCIEHYALASNDSKYFREDYNKYDMYQKEERKERQQKIMRFFNSLRDELKKYIYEQDRISSNLNLKECRILFSVLGLDTSSYKSIYDGILNNYIGDTQRIHFNVNNRIISFNYTDPYWLLGWCVFGSVNSTSRMPMLRANNNLTDVFWPIHGHFLNDDLVLGAKADEEVPPELYFLVKENQYDDDRKTKFTSILKQSELIIVFGHSIHGTDLEYYLPFLRSDLNQDIFIITGTNQEEYDIKTVLAECKIKRKNIYYIHLAEREESELNKFEALIKRVEETI